jgi:parallel beta-helix repeat protein
MAAVDRTHREMQIDESWTLREERGFTWWGAWVRQRVWSGEAVRSLGEKLWHVRARTPLLRDVPDEPATYALLEDLNELQPMSAMVFDPEDGTISARCGVFVYEGISEWLTRWFMSATALQSSMAWLAGRGDGATGRTLDSEPHPTAGARMDPDDMLNVALADPPRLPAPFTRTHLRRIAKALEADGYPATLSPERDMLIASCGMDEERAGLWGLRMVKHPILGPSVFTRLQLMTDLGPLRGAWIANALNAAEGADWNGERRPHALGSWQFDGRRLAHVAVFPSPLIGRLDSEDTLGLARNLYAWSLVRAAFAWERLPWLDVTASAKYPDDAPLPDDEGEETSDDEAAEPFVPFADRDNGPATRKARPRPPVAAPHTSIELLVDPATDGAYAEIDDAVAAAEDGDVILVRPATYRKPVTVDRAVTIRADGAVEDVILEPVGGECLAFMASGARVEGLTIRPARTGNDGAIYSAVIWRDTEGTIERCRLSTHQGATAHVVGPSSLAVMRDCAITDGGQNAVWVIEEGHAELTGCRISGNRWPATATGEHATLRLTTCEIVDNLDAGLAGQDRALLVVENCTIARNAGAGVLLGLAAPDSRVTNCVIESHLEPGVMIGGGHGCTIVGNTIRDNAVGIAVTSGATPRIESNEVDGNETGIGVSGRGSNPVVVANTIARTRRNGVLVFDEAAGRFQKNTVSASGAWGVWVDDAGSRPAFIGNHISGCADAAILVTDGAAGEFTSNDLRGNATGSWQLDQPGDLVRTGNLEDAGTSGEAWGGERTRRPGGEPGRMN